jgi:hypothetical protein
VVCKLEFLEVMEEVEFKFKFEVVIASMKFYLRC